MEREQGVLKLPPEPPKLGRGDFLVSDCNRAALAWIECWPDWPARALVLHGPEGSGKSHLVTLWRDRSGAAIVTGASLAGLAPSELAQATAVAVDDAERSPEEALLHLYNCCGESGAGLVVVAREPPARWPIALPDLASRLRAAPDVAIGPPDDGLLAAMLVKHFADRQVRVEPAVIAFLVPRIERSFAAAAAIVARLDGIGYAARRPITIAVARHALAQTA